MFVTIAFCGKIGVGKNFVSERVLPNIIKEIEQNYNIGIDIEYMAFANILKEIVLFNKEGLLSREEVFIIKSEPTRKLIISTSEELKNKYGLDYFAKRLYEEILDKKNEYRFNNNKIKLIVITDLRFIIELEYLEKLTNCFIVRVNSPLRNDRAIKDKYPNTYLELSKHPSETELDDIDFTEKNKHEINNDLDTKIEDLEYKLRSILTKSLKLE